MDATKEERRSPGSLRPTLNDLTGQATAGMREATRAVARCQPFCVYCATIDGRKDRSFGLRCRVSWKLRNSCTTMHAPCHSSRASTKCHSSTAENSPKRSWISRSDHSRKIQLVV